MCPVVHAEKGVSGPLKGLKQFEPVPDYSCQGHPRQQVNFNKDLTAVCGSNMAKNMAMAVNV